MRQCKRPGCEKPVKPGHQYCGRRCVYDTNVLKNSTLPMPKRAPVPTSSWWTDHDSFYQQARERFPSDAPTKSQQPVLTYGVPGRDVIAAGRHRLKERRRDRERRMGHAS